MKIAFNRKIRRSPWGGGAHFHSSLVDYIEKSKEHTHVPLEIVRTSYSKSQTSWSGKLHEVDCIIMLDPRTEEEGFDWKQASKAKQELGCKILHRVNDTGVTRGGNELDDLIMQANSIADHTVFISEWVKRHFVSKGYDTSRSHSVITNGCDTTFFHPKVERDLHKPMRLVTHHWSSNPAKGLDLYERIDELIDVGAPLEFTYVGRYPVGHVPKHTKIVAPLYGQALGDELRKHDVYVTAARWEACGSHHVEGAACGLPVVYHKDGGGVVEMCRRYGEAIGDPSELKEALTKIKNYYGSYAASAESADLSAETMCEKYLDVITRMR